MEEMLQRKHGCLTSCSGLHADVQRVDESMTNSIEKVSDALLSGEEERYQYKMHNHTFIQWSRYLALPQV